MYVFKGSSFELNFMNDSGLENYVKLIYEIFKPSIKLPCHYNFISIIPKFTLDWLFFNLCASSTTSTAQSIEPNVAVSMLISS